MIDTQKLNVFRADFEAAMKSLEQKYGLVISLGSIHYTATSFHATLNAQEGDSQDEVNEGNFRKYCGAYGLAPEDYDRRFSYRGEDYIIVGIRPSKRKYPICCTRVKDNSTYGFTAELVKSLLRK